MARPSGPTTVLKPSNAASGMSGSVAKMATLSLDVGRLTDQHLLDHGEVGVQHPDAAAGHTRGLQDQFVQLGWQAGSEGSITSG